MNIQLDDNLIALNTAFNSKQEAIKYCGNLFYKNNYITAQYIDDMLKRDRDCSVYIGNGVAIPHGLVTSDAHILKSAICIVQVPDGVEFETGCAKLLIGIAAKNNEQIAILEKIANLCCDLENVEKLTTAQNVQQITNLINN